ncbi:TetR/AcrR family transcriptional regulator [Streptomyces sp. NBC_01198]|uniref:TetR/AcrR family transcriptional regulator n=1 Tax=Streptomyces sp. NBC_01198 TaxID=2903769 RepID=UPI002E15AFC4|nr:TetR/AcrR family transcriptional regulator [Streptomyces sp. NBC_01198]
MTAATWLFREHGYAATTIGELTRAMETKPGSLYAAFGDKKSLFKEVVHVYGRSPPVRSSASPWKRSRQRATRSAASFARRRPSTPTPPEARD